MKVIVYNDCFTGVRPHFGCDLVMSTFKEQLDRVGIEYIGSISMKDKNPKDRRMEKADLVIVNGEGSFHHNRRNDIAEVSKYFPSILINTVYEDNNVDLSSFKYISARESRSAASIGCPVIPDIIFSSNILKNLVYSPIKGRHYKIMHSGKTNTLRTAIQVLPDIVSAESIETESFHAIAVATILGVPISRIYKGSGVSWKTESLLADIKADPLYVDTARNKINSLFESLYEFI